MPGRKRDDKFAIDDCCGVGRQDYAAVRNLRERPDGALDFRVLSTRPATICKASAGATVSALCRK